MTTKWVLDSSALIAVIKDEPGANVVRQMIDLPPPGGFFIHAINVCEVAYHFIRLGLVDTMAYDLATADGVKIVDEVHPKIWQRAASLKARHRGFALGDCIVVALAESIDAGILTGDRGFQNVDTHTTVKLFR